VSLSRYSTRSMQQRPGRTILTILSIVIGVASVVSVTVTTATTRQAYKAMFAEISGNTALEVTSKSNKDIPQSTLDQVRQVPGVEAAVPLISLPGTLVKEGRRTRTQLLGVDPAKDSLIRNFAVVDGEPLSKDEGPITASTKFQVIIEAEFSKQLGIAAGDSVRLLTKRGLRNFVVSGLFRPQGASGLKQAGIVCMPLGQLQYVMGKEDKISSVQIVIPDDSQVKKVETAIAAVLDEELQVAEPAGRAEFLNVLLAATEVGLGQTTAFSILLASFIILNTFLMNVSERRRHLAIARAIGATRSQVIWMLLKESIFLGILGTIIGILTGLSVAYLLNIVLSKVLAVSLPGLQLSPLPFILATSFGMIMSLAGALVPALRAGKVSPLEGMSRVSSEDLGEVPRRYLVIGSLVTMISAVLVFLGIAGYLPLEVPTYAAVGLLLGIVLMVPLVLSPLAHIAAAVISPFARVETSMALRQVLRNRGRSSLTVGVLFVAGSTGLAMASSIIDNVTDLKNWYSRTIVGDFYVRAMLPDMSDGRSSELPTELIDEVTNLPEIMYLDRGSLSDVRAGDFDSKLICREFHKPGPPPLAVTDGNLETLREQMERGEIVLASVLANKLKLKAGDSLELQTPKGPKSFRVCAVTNDYLVAGMGIYIAWDVGHEEFGINTVDGMVMWAKPGELEKLRSKLEEMSQRYGVLLHTSGEIGKNIDAMVIGIDGCLWGLVALGFVVAAFGVVNTLMMNVLEQTRELGILRIVAMTKKQVRRTIVTQAGIIGAVGLVPGVFVGVLIAYIANMAMEPNFGRKIQFSFHPVLLMVTLGGALLITLLSSFFPARRAARIDVVEALHYD